MLLISELQHQQRRTHTLHKRIDTNGKPRSNDKIVWFFEGTMGLDWADILERAKDSRENSSDDGDTFEEYSEVYFHPCLEQLKDYANEMSLSKSDSVRNSSAMKELVLQTRQALRFCLFCLSSKDESTLIERLQSKATFDHLWHEPLTEILYHRRGDKKCRVLAAKVLSNLVTSNAQTASKISSIVNMTPSEESIASSILETMVEKDVVESPPVVQSIEPNWVDLFLSSAKSRNREAFAATAAFLHNCIASQSGETDFVRKISQNGMLISTLLRHFVSAEAITEALDKGTLDPSDDHWDSATEWIQLLLARLCRLSMFPELFSSIGGDTVVSPSLLPEQNIILRCLAKEADVYGMEFLSNKDAEHPFGGDRQKTYLFLARWICQMAPWLLKKRLEVKVEDPFHDQLVQSGYITINELLGTMLGVDESKTLRPILGREILPDSARFLGLLLDDLSEQSHGRKASEIRLPQEDQRLLVSLVQLIGNLCYKSRDNQDLLRNTLVPPKESRNGLHVLLSCTTHATSCFTLREWGVIAIRNVLEENPLNQAIVEELMAQGPVESAELEQAGVKVQLDSNGKVSLSTIKE